MITNPQAKRILCFGDSNTWGQRPDAKARFFPNERWTGQLQQLLGDNFDIIEEGLNSRTTNLEFSRKPGRNGMEYFRPCLESHNPLDLIIIMLGTNDFKVEFGPRPPQTIAAALQDYVYIAREVAKNNGRNVPSIAFVSPILIAADAPDFLQSYSGIYNQASAETSGQLAVILQAMASANRCGFADAAQVASPGQDGIHMSLQGHHKLARLLAKSVEEWL
ncbi:MAG TPA: GDSL-type esterase/lipase family protein [Candidatus Saccharimonadales bacterium]|nr:GDSL-type esterase/lipase family protein [Candidatus Saccharimonadales bacterium]